MDVFRQAQPSERYALAKAIYQDYMLSNSDFVICLPQHEYDSTRATLQQYEATPLQVPVHMFASAESIVMDSALDVYFRFFNSSLFQAYITLREQQIQQQQLLASQDEPAFR